jgi:hypothetical protein
MNRLATAMALALISASVSNADVAYIPREVLVDRADIIVVGKVTKIDDVGAGQGMEFAVIEVKDVLKGDPKLKSVKQLQPALMGGRLSHRVTVSIGERGVFMLSKIPNSNAYRFPHPSAFSPTTEKTQDATIAEFKKLIEQRAKLPSGKEVNGLVAQAEVVLEGGAHTVRFRLRNVSDKPIIVCNYLGNRPLKVNWVGPDGKEIESMHYDWLKTARLKRIGAQNFVAIAPGGILALGPRGGDLDSLVFDNAPKGESKVTVSFVNGTNGDEFKIKGVWTGTVTANEVVLKK